MPQKRSKDAEDSSYIIGTTLDHETVKLLTGPQ